MKKMCYMLIVALVLGICSNAVAYAVNPADPEDYKYTLVDTGTGWSEQYSVEVTKLRGPSSRAVNNMTSSTGNGSTVLFRVKCRYSSIGGWLGYFSPATNEVWNYCDRKLFTWNSGYGETGYGYKMEARRNTNETASTITVRGSWCPDDKNTP